jgi:5-methyltetrahydropteroyltriglutamate--homocysteine methyltransferase
VIGSTPRLAGIAADLLSDFGPDDVAELQEDAVIAAVHDQVAAGLDAISDGEQTRLDFNLGFYGFIEGIEQGEPPRRFGPPAHDQRAKHRVVGNLAAPRGLGTVEEFERLQRVAPPGPTLKVAVPGPYTLAGPGGGALETAEALLPVVQAELVALADAGCAEIAIDEPR